jgi:hypothetical protein
VGRVEESRRRGQRKGPPVSGSGRRRHRRRRQAGCAPGRWRRPSRRATRGSPPQRG